MNAASEGPSIHSTRLFPVGQGATAYALTGIAARCDWIILSDRNPPEAALVEQRPGPSPRHVFLSMRNPFAALKYFQSQLLSRIEGPFHLISGSEDCTLPEQQDQRWRDFDNEERQIIQAIAEDPRVVSWSAENLVRCWHLKCRPLPLGMVTAGRDSPERLPPAHTHRHAPRNTPPQAIRPVRLLCAHRIREGVSHHDASGAGEG